MHEFDQLVAGDAYFIYCTKALTWNLSFTNPTTQFTYDGDGGRVTKSVFQPANTKSQITLGDTIYVGSLYEVESSGKTTKHIFAGANKVCAIEKTAATSEMYYFHSDHLGSSNLITDETGKQAGLTQFSPYGSTFKQTGTYDPKHKFTGKELDPSTGLYYYGARYYDAQLGRFITQDPSGMPDGPNVYLYCNNDPLNFVDLWGLCVENKKVGFSICPRYGNWGGLDWSGGKQIKAGEIGPNIGIADQMDGIFKTHDFAGYAGYHIKNPDLAYRFVNESNIELYKNVRALPEDPRNWNPPAKNVLRARIYRMFVETYFLFAIDDGS